MKKIFNYIKTHSKMLEIGFMLTAALIGVTATFVIWITYGWFVTNDKSSVNGVEITSNGDTVHLRDYIKITRTLSKNVTTTWYKRDSSSESKDKSYYKINLLTDSDKKFEYAYEETTNENGTTSNNKIPMTLANIFPNETVDVTLWYYPDETLKNSSYNLYLANLKDHNNDGTTDEDNFGRFSVYKSSPAKITYHSAFGVFKAGELVQTSKDDGTSSLDFGSDSTYLATYKGTHVDDETFDSIKIKTGSFVNETPSTIDKLDDSEKDSYYETTFRIKLDLTQFNNVFNGDISTNKLSEKYVEIGAIRIIA